jgi:ribonuclease T
MSSTLRQRSPMARRFRGFLPVVIDVETGGFNPETDALLEIAAVLVGMDDSGSWRRLETIAYHVEPFHGANLERESLEFTGIDPYHPFRFAVPEHDALKDIFAKIHAALTDFGCTRAILVGHNSSFDLAFVKAAARRCSLTKRNPFHAFSTFDTVPLVGLAYGQTVLSRAAEAAGFGWDNDKAHSAIYDAEQTAELFCAILNRWDAKET